VISGRLFQVVCAIDELHTLVGRDCLPSELGGSLQYDHDAWCQRCKVCTVCYRHLPPVAITQLL